MTRTGRNEISVAIKIRLEDLGEFESLQKDELPYCEMAFNQVSC